jgi:hypothetical protein
MDTEEDFAEDLEYFEGDSEDYFDSEKYYHEEHQRLFQEWDKPFSEEAICGLDPFVEIRMMRSSLNSEIFNLERFYPFIRCRNLKDVDSFYVLRKSTLEANDLRFKEMISNPEKPPVLPQLSPDQKIFLLHLHALDMAIKRIGGFMRRLHVALLKEGLLVKRVRRKRKHTKALMEDSSINEEVIDPNYLDLNVRLPDRPLNSTANEDVDEDYSDDDNSEGECILPTYGAMEDEEHEFDSDRWYMSERYGNQFSF